MSFTPQKLYYKIGEVCEIVGVEAHVLRYWESEFHQLSPPKNKGGQRTYRPKDIELLLQICKLLYEEGFTIVGARKHLSVGAPPELTTPILGKANQRRKQISRPAEPRPKPKPSPQPQAKDQRLKQVRKELENILTLLERG